MRSSSHTRVVCRLTAMLAATVPLLVGTGAAASASPPSNDDISTATATANAAAVAYRTNSGHIRIAEPQGLESTVVFSDFNVGNVRLATTTPVVVQTGSEPRYGPGLPVSLLTGTTGDVGPSGQQGYRFRAIDQNGVTVAARPGPSSSYAYYYHASIPFTDAARAAGIATVTTDARGIATVRFAHPLAAAPVSVVVTGSSPYVGPGLPLNLIASGYSTTGFGVRALDQAGAPIASRAIRLHYWATIQPITSDTRAGTVTVTPNSLGSASIPWPMFPENSSPESVVVTGVGPAFGPNMPVNLLVSPGGAGGLVRVLNQAGRPITSPVRIAFYATWAGVSPL
jgi:hypothetical protein